MNSLVVAHLHRKEWAPNYIVVIPSYNRPELLKRALDSVFAQTVPPTSVMLVIDEANGENDYNFLKHYGAKLQVQFTGGGFGGARSRNVGLDAIKNADYVFFLDDDDEWLTKKIEQQIHLLENDKDLIAVTCWNYRVFRDNERVDRVERNLVGNNINLWNTVGSFSFFGYRFIAETHDLRLESSLTAAQDWEFYIRIAKLGSIGVVEEYLVNYYAHSGPRISSDPYKKLQAWKSVLELHEEHLSIREKGFIAAKLKWKSAQTCSSKMERIRYSLVAIALSLFFYQRLYSLQLVRSSCREIFDTLCSWCGRDANVKSEN